MSAADFYHGAAADGEDRLEYDRRGHCDESTPKDATVETRNSEQPPDEDAHLDGSRHELLSGKAVASALAVALALSGAVVWEAMSDDAPVVDADSAAFADADSGSGSGSDSGSSPSSTPTTATEPAGASESASGAEQQADEHRTEEAESPESESGGAASTSSLPRTGVYRARQEASGLCMTWGDEPGGDRSVMVLGDCGSTEPELTWIENGGSYEVEMAFDDWTPCMTVDNGGTEDGMLVGFDGCDGLDAQTWELVPVGAAYQLRTAASSSLCLSVLKSSSAESGDAVSVQNCDSGDAKQQWTLL
jgi:hypothetical protein